MNFINGSKHHANELLERIKNGNLELISDFFEYQFDLHQQELLSEENFKYRELVDILYLFSFKLEGSIDSISQQNFEKRQSSLLSMQIKNKPKFEQIFELFSKLFTKYRIAPERVGNKILNVYKNLYMHLDVRVLNKLSTAEHIYLIDRIFNDSDERTNQLAKRKGFYYVMLI